MEHKVKEFRNANGTRMIGNYPENAKYPLEYALKVKHAVFNRGDKRLKDLLFEYDVPYWYLKDVSSGKILKNK